MKAFSRVPDPFGQNLETAQFEIPFKPVIQIEAIPQGQICHVIKNPSSQKKGILEIDLSQEIRDDIGKESMNTAMTEGNPVSKQFEDKQKIHPIAKRQLTQGEGIKNILSFEGFNIDTGSQEVVEIKKLKKLELQQSEKNQQFGGLPLESNKKEIVSHIVISQFSESALESLFQKRPIFVKDKSGSPLQKANFDQQVDEEGIECSFFGNQPQKAQNNMKKTGFNPIESFFNFFKDQPKSLKDQNISNANVKGQKKLKGQKDLTFCNKKSQIKYLGGLSKLKEQKQLKKNQSKFGKLDIIELSSINPVFF